MTNNANQSNIERIVMRRVRTIHMLRPVISFGTLAALAALIALYAIGREVWVARVFENMPTSANVLAVSRFWLAAFEHTRLTVQALTLLTLASVVYCARQAARTLSLTLLPVRA